MFWSFSVTSVKDLSFIAHFLLCRVTVLYCHNYLYGCGVYADWGSSERSCSEVLKNVLPKSSDHRVRQSQTTVCDLSKHDKQQRKVWKREGENQ